jgi:transcriptional regulator GlxA family with amidase domain
MRLLMEIGNNTSSPVPEAVTAAIQYMQKNCDRSITSEELADVAKLSVPHFNRVFRSATGRSPMDHFLSLRLGRGKRLLESTSMRIKEIAFQLGYDNPLYFTTIFSRRESMSPHAYRLKYSGAHRR